jgi:hypothetical protein
MRMILALLAVVSINAFAADAQPTGQDAPAPKCYNGDDGKFYSVGEKATISGITVICESTADKKNAQWLSVKNSK